MKESKLKELNQKYNDFLKSFYDGRSTHNTRNKKADKLVSSFATTQMFIEFFEQMSYQDKVTESTPIKIIIDKFNYTRKTNFTIDKINEIIYGC